MKYDDENRALRFASDDEVGRFHDDLTELLRTATISVTRDVDVEVATERAKELMRRHATVLRCLNALRRSLPREASSHGPHEPGDPPEK
jgi:hypothetical protein